jgi:hypothetical protein
MTHLLFRVVASLVATTLAGLLALATMLATVAAVAEEPPRAAPPSPAGPGREPAPEADAVGPLSVVDAPVERRRRHRHWHWPHAA